MSATNHYTQYGKPLLGFSNRAKYSQKAAELAELRKIEEEETLRKQKLLWQKKPLVWLRDRLGEDPSNFKWSLRPGYEKHIWDGDKDPLAEAWLAIANGQWAGIEAATGTSKTYSLARIVLWFLDVHEDALVVTSAPKQDQLKLHLWAEIQKIFYKFKKLRPDSMMTNLRLRVTGEDGEETNEDEADLSKSWQAVGFIAGTGAEEQSATRAQGFHREHMLIILEETPGMPMPVLTAFKNTSTGGHNVILAVGNPDSELDPLHTFCMLPHVAHFRISAYDYPNVVQNEELMLGAVTRASIERRKAEYGVDSNMYKSRVRGISPAQSAESLIMLEWIKQCVGMELEKHNGYNAVGIDVANSENGDKAALAWGKGSYLLRIQDFQCPNATHLAYNLIYDDWELEINSWTNYHTNKIRELGINQDFIGVDSVGVGVATVQGFLEKNMKVQSLAGGEWKEAIPTEKTIDDEGRDVVRPMYHFASLRAQMYWELREDLRKKNISIRIKDELELAQIYRELCTPKFVLNSGYIQVEKKEDIKKRLGGKSPNIADAIAYWNWVRKGYRMKAASLPMLAGN